MMKFLCGMCQSTRSRSVKWDEGSLVDVGRVERGWTIETNPGERRRRTRCTTDTHRRSRHGWTVRTEGRAQEVEATELDVLSGVPLGHLLLQKNQPRRRQMSRRNQGTQRMHDCGGTSGGTSGGWEGSTKRSKTDGRTKLTRFDLRDLYHRRPRRRPTRVPSITTCKDCPR